MCSRVRRTHLLIPISRHALCRVTIAALPPIDSAVYRAVPRTTRGTARYLQENKITTKQVNKVGEGSPHIVDLMKEGRVHLVINTTEGAQAIADSFEIRRTSLTHLIPYYTTMPGARAAGSAIQSLQSNALEVTPIQSYSIGSF